MNSFDLRQLFDNVNAHQGTALCRIGCRDSLKGNRRMMFYPKFGMAPSGEEGVVLPDGSCPAGFEKQVGGQCWKPSPVATGDPYTYTNIGQGGVITVLNVDPTGKVTPVTTTATPTDGGGTTGTPTPTIGGGLDGIIGWVKANPLLAGGLVVVAALAMKGHK